MQIYHYTHEGEYIGESAAERDPLGGNLLIPSHATIIEPPAAQDGKTRVFDGARWVLVMDNRGVWYMPDRTEVKLELLADVVPVGAIRTLPPKSLAVVKTERADFIDAEYERVNQLPISYLGNTFQADNKSTDLMTSALAVLTSVGGTVGISWWNIDNVPVAFTYAQFAGLGVAIFQRGQPYFANKRTKKDLINAAATTEEVEAITW